MSNLTSPVNYTAAIDAAVVAAMPDDPSVFVMSTLMEQDLIDDFSRTRARGTAISRGEVRAVGRAGVADVKRSGNEVAVVAIGYMVTLALRSVEALEANGIAVGVIDPRTMSPLDVPAICESGHVTVADEAPAMCSMGSEIANAVAEGSETFARLKAPPLRVSGCTSRFRSSRRSRPTRCPMLHLRTSLTGRPLVARQPDRRGPLCARQSP
jgi:pyruvate/2-oxoglutarate/acetoin dehydrogenase E1 component